MNPRMFGDYPTGVATYLTIPAIALFGPTVFAIRSVCALLGLLSVPLFGLLAGRLFRDRVVGVLAAALLAVSPWNVLFSRSALAPGMVPFFLVLGMWLLHRLFTGEDEKARSAGAAMLTGVVLFAWTQIYAAQYFFVPGMVAAASLLWLKGNVRRIAIAGCVYVMLVMVAIHVRLHIPESIGRLHRHSIFYTGHAIRLFFTNYRQYQSHMFLFKAPKMELLHQVPGIPHLAGKLAPLYGLGLLTLLAALVSPARLLRMLGKPEDTADASAWRRSALWVTAWLLLGPVAGALFAQQLYTPRVVQFLMGVIMVTALGGTVAWRLLQKLPGRFAAPIFAAVLAGYLGEQTLKAERSMVRANPEFKAAFQNGLPEVMQYLGGQTNVQSVKFSGLNEAYIYHLFFTPVNPTKLKPSLVSPAPSPDMDHWSYLCVHRYENYYFNQTLDFDSIRKHAVLRHKVSDNDGLWFEIYEDNGRWYVLGRG